MEYSLIILFLIVIVFIYFIKKESFDDSQFLKENKEIIDGISSIINDKNYISVVEQIPNQIELNIDQVKTQIVKEYNKPTGTPDLKKKEFVIKKTLELIDYYQRFIQAAENSPNVYTPERLQALKFYYTNKINNCKVVLNYFNYFS